MVNDILMSLEIYRPCDVQYTDVVSPTIVYHGEKDTTVTKECALWMQANMEDCRAVIVAGGSHNILVDVNFMDQVVLSGIKADWDAV